MPFAFGGKRILVTGAGRGIGRALVKSLVEAGGKVFAVSLTKKNLDSLVKELPAVHPIQVDLSDWEATRREVDKIGPLDGLVNNAGVPDKGHNCLDIPKEEIERILNVNLMATINVSQSVGKKMVSSGNGGSIVNISSIGGLRAVNNILAYTVSKAGIDMVTKQFAGELGPHNIRVNSVNPYIVYTDMTKEYVDDKDLRGALLGKTPMKRFLEMREVVDPIMYFLSDHSSMVTGTTAPIDGGLVCYLNLQ